MYSADVFEFTPLPIGTRADVSIDEAIRDKQQLLRAIARGLDFPDYFGENWDALIDCLSDLSWLTKPTVTLDHIVVPPLPSRDLRLYLESLIDAMARRAHRGAPRLRIVFRASDHARVEAALASSSEAV
jgi:hypothetical protein